MNKILDGGTFPSTEELASSLFGDQGAKSLGDLFGPDSSSRFAFGFGASSLVGEQSSAPWEAKPYQHAFEMFDGAKERRSGAAPKSAVHYYGQPMGFERAAVSDIGDTRRVSPVVGAGRSSGAGARAIRTLQSRVGGGFSTRPVEAPGGAWAEIARRFGEAPVESSDRQSPGDAEAAVRDERLRRVLELAESAHEALGRLERRPTQSAYV